MTLPAARLGRPTGRALRRWGVKPGDKHVKTPMLVVLRRWCTGSADEAVGASVREDEAQQDGYRSEEEESPQEGGRGLRELFDVEPY